MQKFTINIKRELILQKLNMIVHHPLRKYPDNLNVEKLELIIKQKPLNESDIYKLFNLGYRPTYFKSIACDGMCAIGSERVQIKRCSPQKEIRIFIHEILHLVFPFNTPHAKQNNYTLDSKCTYYSYPLEGIRLSYKEKYEEIIEFEEERIYKNNPTLIWKIKSRFNFPEGEIIYNNPNQLKLF